jgi:hypothetical protein
MAKDMSEAQRAYEAKRAAKAGVSLEKWMKQKQKAAVAAMPAPPVPAKKPGLVSRLFGRKRAAG